MNASDGWGDGCLKALRARFRNRRQARKNEAIENRH